MFCRRAVLPIFDKLSEKLLDILTKSLKNTCEVVQFFNKILELLSETTKCRFSHYEGTPYPFMHPWICPKKDSFLIFKQFLPILTKNSIPHLLDLVGKPLNELFHMYVFKDFAVIFRKFLFMNSLSKKFHVRCFTLSYIHSWLRLQKTLWPLFMDRVQLPQDYRATTRRQFTWLTSERWKAELPWESTSGFEHRTHGLGIQHLNYLLPENLVTFN